MAVGQPQVCLVIDRYRGQAPSHIDLISYLSGVACRKLQAKKRPHPAKETAKKWSRLLKLNVR